MTNAMNLLARDDVAASLGMRVADAGGAGSCPTSCSTAFRGSDDAVKGDPAPIDPGQARRLILKPTYAQ